MPVYRFGPFQLDPARRELRRDGLAVDLPPKALDLIVYLVEHRERAVGRDELISAVWGRVDVSDNVLDQNVLRARRALGDEESERRFIATRPRFGFAWLAAVETVDGDAGPAGLATPAPPAVPAGGTGPAGAARGRGGRLAAIALATVVLLAILLAWRPWTTRDPSTAGTHSPGPDAVASAAGTTLVLPFDVAGDPDAGWARLGLMDLVAQRLRDAGVDTLRSDNAVALLRDREAIPEDAADLRALAAEAGAGPLVRGRVRFAEGRWHVALQWHGTDDRRVEAGAEAEQPLDAARAAADQLLTALGRQPSGVALPQDPGLALRLQQIDAAVLGDDLAAAQRRLDAVPAELQADPAVRLREATLHFRRGELDQAASRFEALLDQVSASDDARLHGTLHSALGNLALRRGDPAEAERRGEAAIAALAALPPTPELGRALTGRAIARSTQGDYARALEDFAQARVVLDGVGDRIGAARVDINVGILEARRDRYAEAAPLLATAADRLATFRDLTNELFARVTLARVRLGLLDPAAALAGDARLATLVAREPNAERRRYANLARVEVLAANGRLAEAQALLDAVRNDASAAGDIILLGVAQAIAAQWALAGDPATAAREAHAALNAPWEEESPRQFARTWGTLVQARLALGDPAGAAAALTGFEAWVAERDPQGTQVALWLARAAVAEAGAQAGEAQAAWEAALAAAEQTRIPAELLEVAERYVPWLLDQGDTARATALAGRLAAFAERDYGAALATARLHRGLGHGEAWRTALEQARALAGERSVPAELQAPKH